MVENIYIFEKTLMSIQYMSMWQPPESYVKFQWDFRILCKQFSLGRKQLLAG